MPLVRDLQLRGQPGALAGRIVFNSATDPPSVSRRLWGNIGGLPVTPANFPSTSTGTYAVNADCTGTVTFGEVVKYEIAIVDGGAEIEFAYTSSGPLADVGEGVAKKVSETCDATTIAGRMDSVLTYYSRRLVVRMPPSLIGEVSNRLLLRVKSCLILRLTAFRDFGRGIRAATPSPPHSAGRILSAQIARVR